MGRIALRVGHATCMTFRRAPCAFRPAQGPAGVPPDAAHGPRSRRAPARLNLPAGRPHAEPTAPSVSPPARDGRSDLPRCARGRVFTGPGHGTDGSLPAERPVRQAPGTLRRAGRPDGLPARKRPPGHRAHLAVRIATGPGNGNRVPGSRRNPLDFSSFLSKPFARCRPCGLLRAGSHLRGRSEPRDRGPGRWGPRRDRQAPNAPERVQVVRFTRLRSTVLGATGTSTCFMLAQPSRSVLMMRITSSIISPSLYRFASTIRLKAKE